MIDERMLEMNDLTLNRRKQSYVIAKKIMKKSYLILTLWLALPLSSHALQCENVKQNVERLICENPALQSLDDTLQKLYDANADLVSDETLTALRSSQRSWLARVRNRCALSACLADAYTERISRLRTELMQAYVEKDTPALILGAQPRVGAVADVLGKGKMAITQAAISRSYGGSLPHDILPELKSDDQGGLLVGLISRALDGAVVRYWDPLTNIEWIPYALEQPATSDTAAWLNALKQFNQHIYLAMAQSMRLKFASEPNERVECPLSAASIRIRSPRCYPAKPILFKGEASLTIHAAYALADCLTNFGATFYVLADKDGRTRSVRTPLIAMKKPVVSLFGGRPYCEFVPEIGNVEHRVRHRVLEPGLPEWAVALQDGSILILGGRVLQHYEVSYFYRLADSGLAGFQDKRLHLKWVDSDWLITNGHLMGSTEALPQRILNMDRILLKHIEE